ncbi:MAG: rRNA maturation RNase YbeY [Campylobacterales bacterium]|nr:rRNA maturation RNase YbeY [Campylobacterales bacterium]
MEASLFIDVLESITKRDVELVLVDDNEIQDLNKEHRGKDKPTDVLSFPFESEFKHLPLGSIIISVDTAKRQANEEGNSLEMELQILFLHGLLHLQGYDHETDNGEMNEKEEELRKNLNLSSGLINRSMN